MRDIDEVGELLIDRLPYFLAPYRACKWAEANTDTYEQYQLACKAYQAGWEANESMREGEEPYDN